MHSMLHLRPAPALRSLVRYYVERESHLGARTIIHPIPARACAIIEVTLHGQVYVRKHAGSNERLGPGTVLIGLQTGRDRELRLSGSLHSFCIVFQPAALHQIFRLPMHELTNQEVDGLAVLGSPLAELEQRLLEAGSTEERVQVANDLLLACCANMRHVAHPGVSTVARLLLRDGSVQRIDELARSAGLSVRQLERQFREQLGLPPKLFTRIARFERALDGKARNLAQSWADIAHAGGYYDQMHLVHDFAEFTGETPGDLLMAMEHIFAPQLAALRGAPQIAEPPGATQLSAREGAPQLPRLRTPVPPPRSLPRLLL